MFLSGYTLSAEQRDLDMINSVIEEKQTIDKKKLFEKHIAMFLVTKEFIQKNNLILYGGLALNLALPKNKRFYGNFELPDYDFFSYDPKLHATALADTYHGLGYKYIEVKPGIHYETYKVFVDFQPVADITGIPKKLFDQLLDTSLEERAMIMKNNPHIDINLAPLSLLRLAFHIELSRPDGFIERWPKIYKRMVLFYSVYPLQFDLMCKDVFIKDPNPRVRELAQIVLTHCKLHGLPILGLESLKVYMKYHGTPVADNDIFAENMALLETMSVNYKETAGTVFKLLSSIRNKGEKIVLRAHAALNKSELVPEHYVISLGDRPIVIIYNAHACYSYKALDGINVMTIDSILSLTYACTFTARAYYDIDKLKCMINMLLNLQSKHINSKKYVWRRFDLMCFGNQPSLDDVKRDKWNQKKSFFVYRPE